MQRIIHIILCNGIAKGLKLLFEIVTGKSKIGKFESLIHYNANNPDKVDVVANNREETIYAIDQTGAGYNRVLQKGIEINSCVFQFKQASCFAYSDLIVLHKGSLYCEIKENPLIKHSSDCSDGFVLLKDWKYYCVVNIPSIVEYLPKGIFVSGLFSWNYYHFTFQIVTKLRCISMIPADVPLLVDKNAVEIPSFAELLKICNTQSRPILVMDKKVRYKVDELYYVSMQTFLEPNHKKGTKTMDVCCFYKPLTLSFLREMMIPVAKNIDFIGPKRIFLGRKYSSGRRPFNEEECIECAKEFGFEVVYPEMLTLQQQVKLFNDAEAIVGGSGAAFTNLVYCNHGVKVLVLCKYYPSTGLWQPIIEYIGGRLWHVMESKSMNHDPLKMHASYKINIDDLKAALYELLQ